MAEHKDLTGADLHEPKGVAAAAIGRVYVANGSGSGTWALPTASNVSISDPGNKFVGTTVENALLELFEGNELASGRFFDVSSVESTLIPIPYSCQVLGIDFVLGGTIAGADSTVTVTRSEGASMGSQVIAFAGSAEGTTFSFTPAGNNTLTYPTHKYIKIVTDGASTNTVPLHIAVRFKRV